MDQFKFFDKTTHETRLKRIKSISKKQALDDGPVALYHALYTLKAQGHDSILEFALIELERLYALSIDK